MIVASYLASHTIPIFVGSSPAWQMDNVKDDLQETHGNPHVHLLNPCLQPIQNFACRPWISRPGPHPRMIFRPALWQIHFNLFQPPWNPPKQNLKIPKTPSKESSNKQRNPKKIFAKSTSCQACLPYERLFQGKTDGSSFPNGGLRVTHSAAAFTTWDRASPPFVMDKRHGRWQWIRPGSGKMWESMRKFCHKCGKVWLFTFW